MALIDLLMIVGARKRNKIYLLIWMLFTFFDICGRIYILITTTSSKGIGIDFGIGIAFMLILIISGVFVFRGFLEIKRRERENATGGTFRKEFLIE